MSALGRKRTSGQITTSCSVGSRPVGSVSRTAAAQQYVNQSAGCLSCNGRRPARACHQTGASMRVAIIGFLMGPAMAVHAANIPEPAVSGPEATLQTVLVRGSQPGPGLWRVSKGDHTLWILGTLGP